MALSAGNLIVTGTGLNNGAPGWVTIEYVP
jgi:hypothetical protein